MYGPMDDRACRALIGQLLEPEKEPTLEQRVIDAESALGFMTAQVEKLVSALNEARAKVESLEKTLKVRTEERDQARKVLAAHSIRPRGKSYLEEFTQKWGGAFTWSLDPAKSRSDRFKLSGAKADFVIVDDLPDNSYSEVAKDAAMELSRKLDDAVYEMVTGRDRDEPKQLPAPTPKRKRRPRIED